MATNPRPQGVWELSLVNELLTGAYLDFGRRGASPYAGSREVQPGVVVDYGRGDVPIGIEFYDSRVISFEVVNILLDRFDLRRLSKTEYAALGLETARGNAAGRLLAPGNGGLDEPGKPEPPTPRHDRP